VRRTYSRDWSPALGRDMEMLRFGQDGLPLLVFPTSMGRFYQWEDFGMVGGLADKIEAGYIQLWCVDSVDGESWYAGHRPPHDRVLRHLDYERYLVEEVIPRIPGRPVGTGTSFGAMHAILLALRRPGSLSGFVALSGAFDTERWLDGHFDDDVYFTNPMAFAPGLNDGTYLRALRAMEKKVIATGRDDPNVSESIRLGALLNAKDLEVWLDVWDGWAHDWPYWKEMMRKYV
jgi:esterase/lipase superfamily enzyme